jgi:large subunit ribosomal protein L9
MKVIFLKDVPPYKKGEVNAVSDGYARNYLFPQKFALPATESGILESENRTRKQKLEKNHSLTAIKKGLESVQGKIVKLDAKSSEQGTLYAAITPEKISQELSKEYNLTFPKELINQLPHIKLRGEYSIKLQYEGKEYSLILQI